MVAISTSNFDLPIPGWIGRSRLLERRGGHCRLHGAASGPVLGATRGASTLPEVARPRASEEQWWNDPLKQGGHGLCGLQQDESADIAGLRGGPRFDACDEAKDDRGERGDQQAGPPRRARRHPENVPRQSACRFRAIQVDSVLRAAKMAGRANPMTKVWAH